MLIHVIYIYIYIYIYHDWIGLMFMMPLYSLYVSFHLLGCLKCVCPPLHKQLALFIAYFLHSPVTKNPQILIWK